MPGQRTGLEQPAPAFPFVALIVSGGHSLLMDVVGIGQYQMLGDTLDDAAGEAFDKTAKLLGLGYPGGPALAKLAEGGNPSAFRFARPMTDRPTLDFSFSGLKTQVLLATQRSRVRIRATTGFSSFMAQLQLRFWWSTIATQPRCQPTGALGAPVGFSRGSSPA